MKNKEIKILLSAPRGFCAGVERAIEIVEKAIKKYGVPVYVRHEIVHNKFVVDDLKKKGAIFVEELEEIKDKTRPVIFSAHGVPKKVPSEAESYKMTYVDATCPLVSKVHREAENLHKSGYHLILIGHQNHPEVVGTMGQLPVGSIDLIQDEDEAKKIIELMNELDRKIEKYAPEQQIGDCGYTAKGSYKLYSVIGYDIHNIVEALSLGINIQRNTINGNPPLVEYWDGLEEQEQYVIAGECFDSFDITNDVLRGDDDDFSRLSMYCIDWITTNKGFAGNP